MFTGLKNRLLETAKNILLGNDAARFWTYREKYFRTKNGLLRMYYKYRCAVILRRNNAAIPMDTVIKGKIYLPHGLNGILFSQGAVIGKNCTIFHQVSIGSITLPDAKKSGAPVIGDNVYIGAGAKIIGGVRIGNNARIGAGCVVVEDVPDNCTVVMPKPRIIRHEKPKDNTFISWEDFSTKNKSDK